MPGQNIKVTFYDASATSNAVRPQEEVSSNSSGKVGNAIQTQSSISRSAIASTLINTSKQIMSEGFNTFADFTGNYALNNQINNANNMVHSAMNLMNYPAGTIAEIGNIAIKTAKKFISIYEANQQTNLLIKRAGNEALNNSKGE